MCDEKTKRYIKEVVKRYSERVRSELQRDITQIIDTTDRIETKVDTINGSVQDAHKKIRDLEEQHRRKIIDCPHNEAIEEFKNSLLTATVLKEFIQEEENKRSEKQIKKDNKLRWVVAAIGVAFTIITILVNVIIFYLERQGNL